MKSGDLEGIIKRHDARQSPRRRLFPKAAYVRLKALYDPEHTDRDITEAAKRILSDHWGEIKNTKRDYLNSTKTRATEQAFIEVASLLHHRETKEERTGVGSYVTIATLMPGSNGDGISFTKKADFAGKFIRVQGKIFDVRAWVDEIREALPDFHKKPAELIRHLNEKYRPENLREFEKVFNNLIVPHNSTQFTIELKMLKQILRFMLKHSEYVNSVEKSKNKIECENKVAWNNVRVTEIPERYFFKTEDNIGLDVRSLFFTGFLNPLTKKPLSEADVEKLKNHQLLGHSFQKFYGKKICFIPAPKEAKLEEPEHKTSYFDDRWNKDSSLEAKQKNYNELCCLLELNEHLGYDFLTESADPFIERQISSARQFQDATSKFKSKIVWSEMSDKEFFEKAEAVIKIVKKQMGSKWVSSTMDFFKAVREFAFNAEAVVARSCSQYIRSNNEYVVREGGLETREGGIRGIRNIAKEFRECFEIAYRYQQLPKLMGAMTPHGVCVAEKMRHMTPIFGGMKSVGPAHMETVNIVIEGVRVGSLNEVFFTIMEDARKAEIAKNQAWPDETFATYIVKKHSGKTKYVDKDQVVHTLDEAMIRQYMKETLLMEGVRLTAKYSA